MIEADLAELVDQDGGPLHAGIGQQPAQQSGLAAAEKPGQHGPERVHCRASAIVKASMAATVPCPGIDRARRQPSAAAQTCASLDVSTRPVGT